MSCAAAEVVNGPAAAMVAAAVAYSGPTVVVSVPSDDKIALATDLVSGAGRGAKVRTGEPSRSPGSRKRPGVQSDRPASRASER